MRVFGKLLVAVIVWSVLASSWVQAGEVCIPINAKAKGMFTGPTTTASQIIGGGILHGTTTAVVEVTGVIAPGVVSFVSTLALTTKHGALTLFFADGVFNLVTGEFSADSVVVGGTGRFAGASGELFFHGFSFPDGTFIDDEISGEICVIVP